MIITQVKFFPYLLQGMLAGIKVGIETLSLQILPIFSYYRYFYLNSYFRILLNLSSFNKAFASLDLTPT